MSGIKSMPDPVFIVGEMLVIRARKWSGWTVSGQNKGFVSYGISISSMHILYEYPVCSYHILYVVQLFHSSDV